MRPSHTSHSNRPARSRRALIGLAMSAGLLLAACGGDDDSSSDTTTAATTAAPAADSTMGDSMTDDAMMGAYGPACTAVQAGP